MLRSDRTSTDIATQLRVIARRLHVRRVIAAAMASIAAVVAGWASCLGLDRWLLPPAGAPLRVATTMVAVAIFLTAILWFVRVAGGRLTPLAVARRLDAGRDAGDGLLASACAFAHGDPGDARAGSADLRRAAVLRAAVELETLDTDAMLPRVPVGRAALALFVAGGAVIAATLLAPAHLQSGLQRLANPWSTTIWPRRHRLQFVGAPALAPRGGEYVATLTDANGPLPEHAMIEFRTPSEQDSMQREEFTTAGERLTWRRPNLQKSFEFRAVGGDDRTMPWRRVDVAPPPELVRWEATIDPPEYAKRTEETTTGAIRALAGSQVTLRATFSEPIVAATLHPPLTGDAETVTGDLDENGDRSGRTIQNLSATFTWQPTVSGELGLEVLTAAGMRAATSRRVPLEIVPDRPPETTATARLSPLAVLPTAAVPVAVEADDDLGLTGVAVAAATQTAENGSLPIWEQALEVPENGALESVVVVAIADLGVSTGQNAWIKSRAVDSLGQQSTSLRPIELRVVDRRRLLDLLANELAELVDLLIEAQTRQRTATITLQDAAGESSGDGLAEVVALESSVRDLLLGPALSVQELAEELHYRYAINGLLDDAVAQQLDILAIQLTTRGVDLLNAIDRDLVAAQQADQAPAAAEARMAAAASQQTLLELLAAAIDEFQQWATLQQLQRELAELIDDQQDLVAATTDRARAALMGDGPPAPAALRQLAADQREVLWRLGEVLTRADDVATRLEDAQPTDATRLRQLRPLADELRVETQGANAAADLAGGRLAGATISQRDVVAGLQALLAALSEVDQDDAAERLQQLAQLEAAVAELRRQAEALANARSSEGSQGGAPPTAATPKQLANSANQLAEQARSQAPEAAKPLRGAAADLQIGPRGSSAAARKLADAEAAIAAAREEQQTLLAELKLRRLAGTVGELLAAQRPLVEEMNLAESAQAVDLATRQAAIRADAEAAAETVADMPLFAFGLRSAAAEMHRAELAVAAESQEAAAQAAAAAVRRLEHVAAAIVQQQSAARGAGAANPGESPQERRDARRQQRSLAQAIAQIRLLRGLQADLQQRTEQLQQSGAVDAADALATLRAEQNELADVAEKLMRALEQVD
ncbi:MAG: hypothetical protein CMJ58_04550 [Planctomycetaceae bacterium]|nr:hypothetical protein [Planctomycetaceae bacterium]